MIIDSSGSKPLYIQIAEWLENEILSGKFQDDDKIYSQYQLAEMFNINPATAAKGLNLLADEKILYKQRGLGMFIIAGAKDVILAKRKDETLKRLVLDLVIEARRLNVHEEELLQMIHAAMLANGGNVK